PRRGPERPTARRSRRRGREVGASWGPRDRDELGTGPSVRLAALTEAGALFLGRTTPLLKNLPRRFRGRNPADVAGKIADPRCAAAGGLRSLQLRPDVQLLELGGPVPHALLGRGDAACPGGTGTSGKTEEAEEEQAGEHGASSGGSGRGHLPTSGRLPQRREGSAQGHPDRQQHQRDDGGRPQPLAPPPLGGVERGALGLLDALEEPGPGLTKVSAEPREQLHL